MQLETRRARGNRAEDAAAEFLVAAGYQVRERNFQCREGEIDIVAERGELICFVEVRMRSTAVWGDPSQTVSWAKQRKVVRTALRYLFKHGLSDRMVRFDVMSVVGSGDSAAIEHIPGAFDAGM
ncbi:MAG TPA: YraN family protein [Myxococcaceae bacterium]|jgi:putative endonuclease|nr:YraN family protein [Myxococcaceae bacterium]